MMLQDRQKMELQPGDVVCFDFLHQDQADKINPPEEETDPDAIYYLVKGKRRPVMVLVKLQGGWYLVAKLTTKGFYRDGKPKKFLFPIGRVGKSDDISYAEFFPHQYHKNLVR